MDKVSELKKHLDDVVGKITKKETENCKPNSAEESNNKNEKAEDGKNEDYGNAGKENNPEDDLDVEKCLEILDDLDKVTINREILSKTRVGVIVGNLRKFENDQIKAKASLLVDKWKTSLQCDKNKQDGSCKKRSASTVDSDGNQMCKQQKNDSVSPSISSSQLGMEEKDYPGPTCDGGVRDRVRRVLWKAFVSGLPTTPPKGSRTLSSSLRDDPKIRLEAGKIIAYVEDCIHIQYVDGGLHNRKRDERIRNNGADEKDFISSYSDSPKGDKGDEKIYNPANHFNNWKEYHNQVKTLKFNFQDVKNPDLNMKVLWGVYSPEDLATMTSQDLASDEKKKEREKQKKESMEACQSDWEIKKLFQSMQGKKDEGQFPCFKCKTNKTVYFQMQTRSADEPMTTFVSCLNCGNRWKF